MRRLARASLAGYGLALPRLVLVQHLANTTFRGAPGGAPSRLGRVVHRSFDEAYLDRVRAHHATEAYTKAMRKRAVWVEPLFGEAKQWHGLRRFRVRGLPKVNTQALLTAAGQNLKRLLQRRGWGRRPWPGCPAAALRSRRRQGARTRSRALHHSW